MQFGAEVSTVKQRLKHGAVRDQPETSVSMVLSLVTDSTHDSHALSLDESPLRVLPREGDIEVLTVDHLYQYSLRYHRAGVGVQGGRVVPRWKREHWRRRQGPLSADKDLLLVLPHSIGDFLTPLDASALLRSRLVSGAATMLSLSTC